MRSLAEQWAVDVVAHGVDPNEIISALSVTELAALVYDWSWWARSEQMIEVTPGLRSIGFLTGRGFGKTRSIAEFVVKQVMEGNADRVCLIAQNATKSWEVMVEGECGLLRRSPPWFTPDVVGSKEERHLVWPNGAQAFCFTPESPGAIRGPGFHVSWCSEIIAWPASTREESWMNVDMMTRLGLALTLWDTTPKARNPVVRRLLARAQENPIAHRVIRGSTAENVNNLSASAVAEWHSLYAGTSYEREELNGEFIDDADGALFKSSWIDSARRNIPTQLTRTVLAIDPAISTERRSDATGLVVVGLGIDGQAYVLRNYTARMTPDQWTARVLELYREWQCDCFIAERNRGGDMVAFSMRGAARSIGKTVEVVRHDARTRYVENVLYMKEVHAYASKGVRAEIIVPSYEKGMVSHVIDADLRSLEDTMCTWNPEETRTSPNDLDALVYGVIEVLGLASEKVVSPDAVLVASKMQDELRSTDSRGAHRMLSALTASERRGSRVI